MNTKDLGILGEKIAEDYLKNRGYKILDRNYSFRISGSPQKGEIDIIAEKEDIITFFEVKTLKNSHNFFPEEKVNFQKQRKLIKTSESWLMEKKIPLNTKWQIDVIAVEISQNNKARLRHFKNNVF